MPVRGEFKSRRSVAALFSPTPTPRRTFLHAAKKAKASSTVSRLVTPKAASATPAAPPTAALDGSLVGETVQVWWGGDAAWFTGRVIEWDPDISGHTVKYEDGEEDTYRFTDEKVCHALDTPLGRPHTQLRPHSCPDPGAAPRRQRESRVPSREQAACDQEVSCHETCCPRTCCPRTCRPRSRL